MRKNIQTVLLGLVLACLFCPVVALRAQPVPAQQFEENQRNRQQQTPLDTFGATNAPQLYPGENVDVGPQYILEQNARHTLFEGAIDTQYAFTDNNNLAHNEGKNSAGMVINTIQLAFAPTAYDVGPGKLAPQAGFRSQWYNYGLGGNGQDEEALDFDAQTAFLSAQYLWRNKWELDTELDYTRLLAQDGYKQFYSEWVPNIGLQRLFTFGDNMVLGVGLQEDYRFTDVPQGQRDVNNRLDSTFNVTFTYQVVENLIVQPYYRFEETYYPDSDFGGRNDFLHTAGGVIAYYFTPQISARAYASESTRTSDDSHTTSYNQFNTGFGVSIVLRF